MASTAADRGWGRGWPTDNRKKCGWAEGGGVRLLVRAEIVELVCRTSRLVNAASGGTLSVIQCLDVRRERRFARTQTEVSYGASR